MPWIITKDYLNGHKDDPLNRKGVCSHDCPKDWKEKLPDRFRLFDDDGNLYYEGRFDLNADEPFEVLDWAAADAGCMTLKYRISGERIWDELIGRGN